MTTQYRGHAIDAADTGVGWQANVDGKDVGDPQPSRQHAFERARAFVNRSEGKPKIVATRLADDDDYWQRLRDGIRAEN